MLRSKISMTIFALAFFAIQQLDLTLFSAGLYIVTVQTESGDAWHGKVVKQ